jgi:hypothetical protein
MVPMAAVQRGIWNEGAYDADGARRLGMAWFWTPQPELLDETNWPLCAELLNRREAKLRRGTIFAARHQFVIEMRSFRPTVRYAATDQDGNIVAAWDEPGRIVRGTP